MNIKTLIAVITLSLALPAAAQFQTVELAHEVALNELRLPVNAAGTISFKSCGDCPYQTQRVTARTRYEVNGRNVPLEKFRSAVARVNKRNEVAVTVFHHLENDVITKISVNLR